MLRQQMAALLEATLPRMRPGPAFTAAVVAALPTGMPEAAVAAGGMSATAKAVVGASLAGPLAGAAVGLLGAFIGARASIVNTRSPRERAYMVRLTWRASMLAFGFVGLQAALLVLLPSVFRSLWWHLPVAAVYAAVLLWVILRANRRQRQIQIEDSTAVPRQPASPRERRFLVLAGVVSVAYVALCLVAENVLDRRVPGWDESPYVVFTAWTLYLVGLMQVIAWINRRQHAIRVADGTAPPPPPPGGAEISPRAIYSSLGGGVVGSVLWMLILCAMAGDWLVALSVLASAAVILQTSARVALRRPERYFRIAFWSNLATGGLTLAVVNLRYETWMAFYRTSRWYQPAGDWPLWLVDLALGALIVALSVQLLRRDRQHRRP
jgi:Ca2+/Na+ antiporter